MTLLISVFAAVISTVCWYRQGVEDSMHITPLCYMFWGASILWLVDGIYEYAELGAAYFTPEPLKMLNDAFLGFSVVAIALVIWVILLLVKDPQGVVRAKLLKNREKKEDKQ